MSAVPPRFLTAAAGIMRRPVAMCIGGLGILAGFPVGRLLHDPPWSAPGGKSPRPPAEFASAPGSAPASKPTSQKTIVTGLTPEETEALRVVEQLAAMAEEWQNGAGAGASWLPLPVLQQATALGTRPDVELVIHYLCRSRSASGLTGVVLSAWADHHPEAAWMFYLSKIDDRRSHLPLSPQFVRRMASRHWSLIESTLTNPEHYIAQEAWTQRLKDAAHDPAEVRRLALAAPEGRLRSLAMDRAASILTPEHPREALALLEADPDVRHRPDAGRLAEYLAGTHPEMALELVRSRRLEMIHRGYFSSADDSDAAAKTLTALARRDTAPALALMAEMRAENLDNHMSSEVAQNLPRRASDWLPGAVAAAQKNPGGAELLGDLLRWCPWENSAEVASAIAGITDVSLQAAAVETWAARWSVVEPEAARQWAETLPPAARARALCGLWQDGTPPGDTLAACARAGVLPAAYTLESMTLAAPEATNTWLAEQPSVSPRHIARAARAWASQNPAAAAAWAAEFSDAATRLQALAAAVQQWVMKEPAAAADWLENSSLDDADFTTVRKLSGL